MKVSFIVPCLNEEKTISSLLDALNQQTFPSKDLEIIIADGFSTDATRQIICSFIQKNPRINLKVVDNPARSIPAAINIAAKEACGKYLLRMDAHAFPATDYAEKCYENLEKGIGDNVGGVCIMIPGEDTWLGKSIAEAVSHPLGVGDALYRFAKKSAYVDTVPFGAFRRDLFFEIGGFNENLQSNEDYEFNTRLRQKGYRIFLDASIKVAYSARSNLPELARQYFRYGFWKYRMLINNPRSLRLRQALPPLFASGLITLLFFSVFFDFARILLLTIISLYFLTLAVFAFHQSLRKKNFSLIFGMPLAIATMHLSWGLGFLCSIARRSLVE